MRPKTLLERLRRGQVNNIRFGDFVRLVESYGFVLDRIKGSHRLYRRPELGARLNVQPLRNGDAKSYQLRQFLTMVDKYDLKLEGTKDE